MVSGGLFFVRKNNTLYNTLILYKNNFLCLSILKIGIKRLENGIFHEYLFDKMFHLEFDSPRLHQKYPFQVGYYSRFVRGTLVYITHKITHLFFEHNRFPNII